MQGILPGGDFGCSLFEPLAGEAQVEKRKSQQVRRAEKRPP